MDSLERNVLWLGVEDYTGLWDVVMEAGRNAESGVLDEARQRARRAVESLLARELIELFVCHGVVSNETAESVPAERQSTVLDDAASWRTPEEEGETFWFASTDRGFAAYREETGWVDS